MRLNSSWESAHFPICFVAFLTLFIVSVGRYLLLAFLMPRRPRQHEAGNNRYGKSRGKRNKPNATDDEFGIAAKRERQEDECWVSTFDFFINF